MAGGLISASRTLVWVDRRGGEEVLATPPRGYSNPPLSPDGTQMAIDIRDEELDIWLWNFARETLTRLTFDPGFDRFPVWSPDGRRIAFSSVRDGSQGNLFWQAADGSGPVERLADQSDRQLFPTAFSSDGTAILIFGTAGGGGTTIDDDDISIIPLDADAAGGSGTNDVRPLLATTFGEMNGDLSPDGRWLAYQSNESGQNEIYVRQFPDVDAGRWQVSTGGGTQPLRARSGRELFYRNAAALMAVPVETGPSFAAGNAELLFEGQDAVSLGARTYDVSPDGERFLMVKEVATENTPTPPHFILVQNWFEELNRLVPAN